MTPQDVWISASHFTAGGEIGGKFAPIIRYMEKWSVKAVKSYCDDKGWECKVITQEFDKEAEKLYRTQERLGHLCGTSKPTLEQTNQAESEADEAIRRINYEND